MYQKLSVLFLLLALPMVFVAGILLSSPHLYLMSVGVCLLILLSFFIYFEGQRPKARYLVLLAVLCALSVAGRAAFFFLPNIKPMGAIVILCGVCLGPQSGFLVGAVSLFVSNFLFGQGPWTPYQMVGFGIMGLLAGLLFYKKDVSTSSICIFGFFVSFFVYGPLMDMASLLLFSPTPEIGAIGATLVAGIPFNLAHSVGTVLFLSFLTSPAKQKLSRVKLKYEL